jgi:hypothetical protein
MSATSTAEPTTVDRGPRQVARRIEVQAPAAEIFARLADPRQHAGLDGSGSVQSNVSGPTHLALGDSFVTSMRMFAMPYKTTSTITACEEPRLIEWALSGGQRWRWELHELAEGGTEVTEVFDYRASPGARVLEIAGMPKRNARGIEDTLRSLRRHYAADSRTGQD